jgi:hypothetical protein
LHDLAEYESLGLPAVLVASEEFVSAAVAQSVALGTKPAVIYVQHPIQSRSDAEMEDLADQHVDQAISELIED